MNKKILPFHIPIELGFTLFGWSLLLLVAYGRLIFHPGLHTACPENDTWNLPVRWSVLTALRGGHFPLWNPNSCFGIPWLANWTTECFYPGTAFFCLFGLSFWNFSGLLHLFIMACGIFLFLRRSQVSPAWAFLVSGIALLNACAFNHLGSNSPTDTMAWSPWIFLAVLNAKNKISGAGFQFFIFLALQVFAGYPQITFYTLVGALIYAFFIGGPRLPVKFIFPFFAAAGLSACQWLPAVAYFGFQAARLPAVPSDPHFILPLKNLLTFFRWSALAQGSIPASVASPTFFYFNFYSAILTPLLLLMGFLKWKKLPPEGRFFLASFFLSLLWCLGAGLPAFTLLRIPFPDFLEPAKAWTLTALLELFAVGFILEKIVPSKFVWKILIAVALLGDLTFQVISQPLERNLIPPNPQLTREAQALQLHLGTGRLLILPNAQTRAFYYTPRPTDNFQPRFKHFLPNSNLFASLPLANFYGSTWPSLGALDAQLYFEYGFPYTKGRLLDLFGVDLLSVTEPKMPKKYRKLSQSGEWTLWKNPGSLGGHFLFWGTPKTAGRKESLQAFATGQADPTRDLYLNSGPFSTEDSLTAPTQASVTFALPARGKAGFLIRTQNALPGWHAWIDGKPAPLYQADGLFQAVPFGPEARILRLDYDPVSFRLGLFLSLLTLGFLAAYWKRFRKV